MGAFSLAIDDIRSSMDSLYLTIGTEEVMAKESRFTEQIKCGHCQNKAPMTIVAEYKDLRHYSDGAYSWDGSTVYELCVCPACESVTLRTYDWNDMMESSDVLISVLYPSAPKTLNGLPSKVANAYEAAQKVRKVDANAYGVLLGRVLEIVCDDRGASGDTLDRKLKSLASSGEIPEKLVQVAAGLRQMRNIGAHASLGELTEHELPVLDDLTRAILDYVYSAPHLANTAATSLEKLKRPKPVVAKKSIKKATPSNK
jgi:hypothetical protein